MSKGDRLPCECSLCRCGCSRDPSQPVCWLCSRDVHASPKKPAMLARMKGGRE